MVWASSSPDSLLLETEFCEKFMLDFGIHGRAVLVEGSSVELPKKVFNRLIV